MDSSQATEHKFANVPPFVPCYDLIIQGQRPCPRWIRGFFSKLPIDKLESLTLQLREERSTGIFFELEDEDFEYITTWIKHSLVLKRLAIRNMSMTMNQEKSLARAIRESKSPIVDLDLTLYNKFVGSKSKEKLDKLMKEIQDSQTKVNIF